MMLKSHWSYNACTRHCRAAGESRKVLIDFISCSVTADTTDAAVTEIREAADFGADVVELRIDFLKDINLLNPAPTLKRLLDACKAVKLPAIITFRPAWEGCASYPISLSIMPKAWPKTLGFRSCTPDRMLNSACSLSP